MNIATLFKVLFSNCLRFIFALVVLLVSCSQDEEGSNVEKELINEKAEILCVPESTEGFLGIIQSSSIGIMRIDESVPYLGELKGYEIQDVDQIVPTNSGIEETRKVYHLFYNMTEVMFLQSKIGAPEIIASLTTYDKRFLTDKCIAVGNSFQDFLKVYTIHSAIYNYEDGLVYVQSNELGSVHFAFPNNIIIDMNLVDKSAGNVEISNLKKEGNIINITIK